MMLVFISRTFFGAGGVLDGVLLFERAQITCLVKRLIERASGEFLDAKSRRPFIIDAN